ncbi:EAL and HDOD domain-containing protein [Pengzhenrongella sp.]|jgi:EAL and modified HD-GYP domain-containing signal transduction protein|uniref:EAL and HDOD domain-containing protein n=1 Tax=Pengzhenrongella sp. TaxID=2888820 RepID=UPI002F947E28
MTSLEFEPPRSPRLTGIEITAHHQPVMRPDRSVFGYAVSVALRAAHAHRGDAFDDVVHAAYGEVDLAALVGASVAFIHPTTAMLVGDQPLPDSLGGLVLEIPGHFADLPDAAEHLRALRARGVGLALAGYVPGGSQEELIDLVDFVKVDLVRGTYFAAYAVGCAHGRRVAVIAERVDSEESALFCASLGVELLQGPLFQRDAPPIARDFSVGEVRCLELVALLTATDVDTGRVTKAVSADPELTMRVLRLVNSSAYGGQSRIDTAGRAVVMLGPQRLLSLVMASLVSGRNRPIAGLWCVLTRAIACRSIADDDTAYTVGLLSAVASQLRVAPADLIARTRVSQDVSDALLTLSGPYGQALAAVLAQEESDTARIEATGLASSGVARAYLEAVAEGLRTATALSTSS